MSNHSIPLHDILYDKTYECPVCYNSFTSKAIRLNINKAISSDMDLYTRYDTINPLLYDAILCPVCGYCSLNKNFDRILPTQAKWIKEQVWAHYKKRIFPTYMSLKDAVTKHQLALICSIVKKSKLGEQGYIALHIAWLYRDLNDEANELIYLKRAHQALAQALESERFPIYNLEANTASYILAAISYRLGDFQTSKQYLSSVILSSRGQLKERALDLKALISAHK